MPSAPRRRAELGLSVALGGLCLAAIGLAVADLPRAAAISDAHHALDVQSVAISRGDGRILPEAVPAESNPPPPALVDLALIDIRAAAASTQPARRATLADQAARRIDAALARRPHWGEAELIAAYIATVRERGDAMGAIAASYRDAPLLHHGGIWRVGVGLDHYATLDPQTRGRVVQEAVWLARTGDAMRTAIFYRARRSAGYRAFLLEWYAARTGDADIVARHRPAP